GGRVDTEDYDGIGVLVFGEEKLAAGIEGEMAGFFAAGGEDACGTQRACPGIDGKDGYRVGSAIRSEEPSSIGVKDKFSCFAAARIARGKSRNTLYLAEDTLF